jgi:serine protease Do
VEVSDPRAERYEPKMNNGVVIIDIKPGTPADRAGFSVGDVVVGVGGKAVTGIADYRKAVAGLPRGRPTIFQVQRGERRLYIAVTP